MAAYKLLKVLKESLKEVEAGVPVNWLGKWAKQVRIVSITKRIKELEKQIKNKKAK
jgi:ABC-type long-subunit fatty acid transport system fused permease/ATPase subunit